jgi:uncharacterized membrane protein
MPQLSNTDSTTPKDLIFVITYVVVSVIIITVPPLNASILRAVVGFPFVLFLPGYTLLAVLFPKNDDLDGIERIALSIGLSICVVVFIGLGLNFTPWGIRLGPIIMALSAFMLIMTALAAVRRAHNRNSPP